uniref:C2H2-type domain-containing protein n=1 Tax=Hucho hucho TaxID=62062 RepID=A0A4W5PV95_9TELE
LKLSPCPTSTNDSQLPKPANPMASMPCQPDPEAIYHCGECGKTFSHLTSLRRHLRSHGLTSEDAKPDTSTFPMPCLWSLLPREHLFAKSCCVWHLWKAWKKFPAQTKR